MTPPIKFGTDGWRAIIADTYTFENVEKVSRATAQWLKKEYGDTPSVVIGHDTRFLGAEFTRRAAQALASAGVRVHVSDGVTTTPIISWAALHYNLSHGIVITASHNPPTYNGFKLKAHFGGPSTPDMIAAVEAELPQLDADFELQSYDALVDAGMIETIDLNAPYLDVLRERLDIEAIKGAGLKIAYDAMYGAGQGLLNELLGDDIVTLHHELNPSFYGQAPEPIAKNLGELSEAIKRENCDVGLATDGDADRIGMYDENGDFVDSHRCLSLLVDYLYNDKGMRGDVVKSFSATDLLDKMADRYGLGMVTTPIGFKHIAKRMVETDVLVGGEESGGLSIKGHIPERDGLYIGLTIVEMMVKRGKTLSELVDDLFERFGAHYAYRNDLHISNEKKVNFMKRVSEEGLSEVAGHTIVKTETIDGFKFRTDAGSWVMVRPSGTEPVLRVYSEAGSREDAEALVAGVVEMVG